MFYRDHAPAHFHAVSGEHEVTTEVETGAVSGRFPKWALALVQEWRTLHASEFHEDWARARQGQPLASNPPLE